MIRIGEISLEKNEKTSSINCKIAVDKTIKNVYVEVAKEYEDYLCYERIDAYIIVLFYWAMKNNHNIESTIPMTEDLYFQITRYLMPILIEKSNGELHSISIKCPLAKNIENKGAVVTGMTCGVDSFYSVLNNYNNEVPSRKLTHLIIMSLADSYKKSGNYQNITKRVYANARKVARKIDLPLIELNSNIRELFPTPPMHTLLRIFGIYTLQKLFGVYYFSSGYPIWTFNINDATITDSARYDLLLCKELTTKNLAIYSDGGEKKRIEKLQKISDIKLVKENLHVCDNSSKNCGKCEKCVRTMCELDCLGKLEEYSNVFNLKEYHDNIDFYLSEIIRLYNKKDIFIYEYIYIITKKYKDNPIIKNFKREKTKYICCKECYKKADYIRKTKKTLN